MRVIKLLPILTIVLLLTSCSNYPSDDAFTNSKKIMEHDSIMSEKEYDSYISDLDSWAIGEAYDSLIELPDNLRKINDESEDYNIDTEIVINGFNMYASFKDIDLEEFSNFYLFDSEEYLVNTEGGEGDKPSSAWNDELTKRFNPKKNHNVEDAKCFIGYGYYTIKFGTVEYRYYLAVKCNLEGKVEKFINNYLGTN